MSSLSAGPSVSNSIWGLICKKVHGRNCQSLRAKFYLKWKNNSHNIHELVERIINTPPTSSDVPSAAQPLVVSISVDSISPERIAALRTATIYQDIVNRMKSVCNFHGPIDREEISWDFVEIDLLDDRLLLIWSSSASDLSVYCDLKQKDECVELRNSNGNDKVASYYYNNNQAQLWVDGSKYYGYPTPTPYENFWEFENIIHFEECNSFVSKFSNTYEHEIIEQTSLVLMWIALYEIECKYFDILFDKKYLLLTTDQLSAFVHWIMHLREQFSSIGIEALRIVYTDCMSKLCESYAPPRSYPLPEDVPITLLDKDFEDEYPIKCSSSIIDTVNDTTATLDSCGEFNILPELDVNGEFLLDADEWESIYYVDLEGKAKLKRDWTIMFSNKLSKIYPMCVLKFKNYWFSKLSSRKVNSPYFRACAECKFHNCYLFDFYTDGPDNTNNITIQFISHGTLSLQHSDGETTHARHVSGSMRTHVGDILQSTPVTKYFHKQFSIRDSSIEHCGGNFSNLKSQESLRRIKFEVNSSSRFSNDVITDISLTQDYYRNLLNEKPIPGYIQYFVKEPFIIHLYTKRQIEVMKVLSNIVLHLDATGSIVRKPEFCTKPIFYYALTLKHPDYKISPIPVAEMISSDQGTAEITHFLNKWYLNSKLVLHKEVVISRVEMDYSWAMIHSTCIAFNKMNILGYLESCWRIVNMKVRVLGSLTVVHLCSAHIMHRLSHNLMKKFRIDKTLRQLILHVFAAILRSITMEEINKIFILLCNVMSVKYTDGKVSSSLVELNGLVTGEIELQDSIGPVEEDYCHDENSATYRVKSPFGKHSIILGKTIVSVQI